MPMVLHRSIGGAVLSLLVLAAPAVAETWAPLDRDGVHDPDGPATSILQQPAEALSVLPRDEVGNLVDWVAALRDGYISPRTRLLPSTEIEVLDKDILRSDTSDRPFVLFPHKAHTEWLGCANCHDHLFEKKAGATEFGMGDILHGEKCGVCHGAVAFPLTECNRCHSIPQDQYYREHAND